MKTLKVSERRACLVLGQIRSTQRHIPHLTTEEENLTLEIIRLATRYGRYGQEQDNGPTQTGRLENKPQKSGENLEERRTEGATKATKERTPLAH